MSILLVSSPQTSLSPTSSIASGLPVTETTLAIEYSTYQSEDPKDFTASSTEVDLTTEKEMGTTRLGNIPQHKTEVTSKEPELRHSQQMDMVM